MYIHIYTYIDRYIYIFYCFYLKLQIYRVKTLGTVYYIKRYECDLIQIYGYVQGL